MDNIVQFKITTHPYDHQTEALRLAWNQRGFAFFLEQGTGKSKIIIDEIVNLIERDMINCAVIIAPNNVHINWRNEFIKHGPPNYDKWAIQIWRSSMSLEKKENATKEIIASGKVLIFLMNIEALSSDGGKNYLKRVLLHYGRVYMAVDESHKIKSPGAARTKAIIELGNYTRIRRIATGTEAEEGIQGLYSQFRFLNQNIIGHRSFTSFKRMFCLEKQQEKATGQIFKQIVGYQNQEELAKRIAPYTYQKRKKDCLDLPDKVYVTHQIEMTREQRAIYNKLQEELLYQMRTGEIVDATMAVTKMMRLQQVLCGHVNTSESSKATEIIPSNRASYVAELVDDASGKVIVFCRFILDVNLVAIALANNDISSVALSSEVPIGDRMDEIDKWRREDKYKALIMTVSTGGTGLTLNEANTTIYYSNSWSGTDRIQSEDRNHRIGTIDKVTYHDLIVPKSIDHRLLSVLRNKKNNAMHFRSIIDVQRFLTDPLDENALE